MFTLFYNEIFPALGHIFAILAEIASLPTAYFGLALIGEELGMNLTNLFTGENFTFTIPSYFAIVDLISDYGWNGLALLAEGILSFTADVLGTLYNIFWSPFTHVPMFIGLPIGGVFCGLIMPLFFKAVGFVFSLFSALIDGIGDIIIPG